MGGGLGERSHSCLPCLLLGLGSAFDLPGSQWRGTICLSGPARHHALSCTAFLLPTQSASSDPSPASGISKTIFASFLCGVPAADCVSTWVQTATCSLSIWSFRPIACSGKIYVVNFFLETDYEACSHNNKGEALCPKEKWRLQKRKKKNVAPTLPCSGLGKGFPEGLNFFKFLNLVSQFLNFTPIDAVCLDNKRALRADHCQITGLATLPMVGALSPTF